MEVEHEAQGQHTGRDTLDTATASETTDSGLGDALDVVAQNLPVTLGTALAKALATLATCRGTVSMVERGSDGRSGDARPVMLMEVGKVGES